MSISADYYRGFGLIKFRNFENIDDLVNRDIKGFSVFVHEYIHYLQETKTTYGHKYTTYILDRTLATINEAKKQLKAASACYNSYENAMKAIDVYNVIEGEYPEVIYDELSIVDCTLQYSEDDLEFYEDLLGDEVHVLPPQITVTAKYGECEYTETYMFGSQFIIEGMATVAERNIYYDPLEKKQLIYDLAIKLVEHIYPELALDKKLLFALFDLAMLHGNPGQMFYAILIQMRRTGFYPCSVDQMYNFAEGCFEPTYLNDLDLWRRNFNDSVKCIFDVNDPDLVKLHNVYINQHFNWPTELLKRAQYIEGIMADNINDIKLFLKSFIKDDSHPVYLKENIEILSGSNHSDFTSNLLIALSSFYELMNYKDKIYCGMAGVCNHNNYHLFNSYCCSNPLEKPREDELCPLQLILCKWQL